LIFQNNLERFVVPKQSGKELDDIPKLSGKELDDVPKQSGKELDVVMIWLCYVVFCENGGQSIRSLVIL